MGKKKNVSLKDKPVKDVMTIETGSVSRKYVDSEKILYYNMVYNVNLNFIVWEYTTKEKINMKKVKVFKAVILSIIAVPLLRGVL